MVSQSCLSALIERQQGLPAHSFANSAVRFAARACISSVLLESPKETVPMGLSDLAEAPLERRTGAHNAWSDDLALCQHNMYVVMTLDYVSTISTFCHSFHPGSVCQTW